MVQRSGRSRRLLAAVTAVVLVVLSTGMPLLDAGGPTGWDAAPHEGGAPGQVDHDHTLCLQHGATAWAPAPAAALPPESRVGEHALPAGRRLHSELLLRSTHHSRAPPSV